MAWVDLPSGHYDDAQKARLTAVSSQPGAQLVYTTDGTTPTAQSRKVASGTLVDIPAGTTTLSVGLLVGTTVSAVITRTYEVSAPDAFTPYDITVNVNVDNVGWSRVNFWAWDDQYGDNFTATGTWPGDAVTVAKTIEGRKWYSHTYRIAKRDAMLSFVFSTASGSPQTVNVYDINKDAFLEIATSKDSQSHYYVTDVTPQTPTAITTVTTDSKRRPTLWYDLQGRQYSHRPTQPGVYINSGKKIMIR